jgi:glycosyltransferase 2 family protein
MSAGGPAATTSSSARGWTGIALKAAFSIGILALLAARTDVGRIGALVAATSVAAIALVFALVVLQTLVTAYRWVLVMSGVGVTVELWPAVQALFASLFINQCLPSYVGGDAYRVYWLYREGHPFAAAVRGVMIDRVSALIALVVMMVVSLPRLFARFPDRGVETGMAVVAAAGVVGTIGFFVCDALPPAWRRVRVVAELAELSTAARRLLLTSRQALGVGPLAILVHALSAVIMWVLARDLGLPLGVLDCLLLVPPIMLLSAVPISISGWGVREGVMVGALGMMGIETEPALALSVLIGVVLLANGLLGLWPLTFGGDRFVATRSPKLST